MRGRHWTVLVTLLVVVCLNRWARADDSIASPVDRRVHVVYGEKWTGFEKDAIQSVVDDFNRAQDRVFVDRVSVAVIRQKTLLATAGVDPPELAGSQHEW